MPESDAGWGRCWAALLWGDLCYTFLLNLCLRSFDFSQLPSLERQERMVWGVSRMDGRHCLSYPISQPSTCHSTQLATRKAHAGNTTRKHLDGIYHTECLPHCQPHWLPFSPLTSLCYYPDFCFLWVTCLLLFPFCLSLSVSLLEVTFQLVFTSMFTQTNDKTILPFCVCGTGSSSGWSWT